MPEAITILDVICTAPTNNMKVIYAGTTSAFQVLTYSTGSGGWNNDGTMTLAQLKTADNAYVIGAMLDERDFSGTAKDKTPATNAWGAKFKTTVAQLKAILSYSPTEQTRLTNGAGLDVWLEATDASSTVSATDKQLITGALKKNEKCYFLDMNVFKQVGSLDSSEVHEMNGEAEIVVTLPANLRPGKNDLTPTFSVLRVHDGAVQRINATYDKEKNTITFKSGKFSSYAVAILPKESATSPDTGDTHMILWYLLIAMACAGAVLVTRKSSKT